MMHSFSVLLLSAGLLLPAPKLPVQGSGASALQEVAWIAGSWKGDQQGSVIEEIWTEPEGNNMIGMFRLLNDGRPKFFELMSISAEKAGITIAIKHFGPDMTGWEAKENAERFRLADLSGTKATFRHESEEGKTLVYERTGDRLMIVLEKRQDGKPSALTFTFSLRK